MSGVAKMTGGNMSERELARIPFKILVPMRGLHFIKIIFALLPFIKLKVVQLLYIKKVVCLTYVS